MPEQPVIPTVVTYDVGQLLDHLGTRLDSGFARIEAKLETKADKADLARIDAKLEKHDQEITQLKGQQQRDDAAAMAIQRASDVHSGVLIRRWTVASGALMLLATAALVLVGMFH